MQPEAPADLPPQSIESEGLANEGLFGTLIMHWAFLSVVVILLLIALFFFFRKWRRNRQLKHS